MKDIIWFKKNIVPNFEGYKIDYHSFKNGDFGDLERVELEGYGKGVTIDFWSSGWLGIHAYNYREEKEVINILLEPEQHLEKEKGIKEIQEFMH